MNDPHSLDDQFLQRLPLPLAPLCRRGLNAKSPLEQHLAAYYLWEAGLKLLGATAIVEYVELKASTPEILEKLKHLARPTIGHWWEFIRDLVPILAAKGDKGFAGVHDLVLGRLRDDLPRAAGLYAALTEALGGKSGSRMTVRLADLFDALVHYRNREIGHGASGQRTDDFYRRMGRSLLLGLSELLERLDILAGRSLVYITGISRHPTGGWQVDRYLLAGDGPRRLDSLVLSEDQQGRLPLPDSLCIEGWRARPSAGNIPVILSLHPLVRYETEFGEVCFINSRRGERRIEYLCYTSGKVSTRELQADEQGALLAGVPAQSVDAAEPDGLVTLHLAEEATASTISSSLADLSIPRTIGEFELLSRLGQGGMGVVYRAWQPSLGRQVALKCLLRSGDPKAEARFAREIQALGRVDHPNVVKVFTSGAESDQWFYAMELVEGAELSVVFDLLTTKNTGEVDVSHWRQALSTAYENKRSRETVLSESLMESASAKWSKARLQVPAIAGPIVSSQAPPETRWRAYIEQVVEIVRQTADAVQALHEADIVHRDVKPGNIIVAANGKHAVLLDLGLAQLADETDKRLTRTRQFVGTLRYASPEQIMAVGGVDHRTDIYSLGATLWELLTLRPIYDADDAMPTPDLMLKIQVADPDRPRKYNRHVPRDLEAIVLKCLHKDLKKRYATAKDLAEDLARWQAGEVVHAERLRLWDRLRRRAKRHRQAILLTLMFLGMTTAIVLGIVGKEGNPATPSEEPLVVLRRAEVGREVDSMRQRPSGAISSHPPSFEEVEKLVPPDYSDFEILSDERVVDLREWKQVPAEHLADLVSPATMTRRIRLRKVRPANEIRFESRTTGAEVYMRCLSNPHAFRVVGQKMPGFVGANQTKVRQMIVDVRDVPLDSEFTVHTVLTFWNSLRGKDDLWFGAMGYESSFKVSLLIIFPEGRPFTSHELKVAPTTAEKPVPYTDREILLLPESHDWVYWEIPKPKAGHVYLFYWKW
jgi:eukaryotic-like serine/threonine-protein kinase